MSAFALRKKLLAQQSQVASPSVDEANVIETGISTDSSKVATTPPKKARKARTTRHTSVERKEAFHRPSELPSDPVSTELSETFQSEVDEAPGSLSPFSVDEENEEYNINSPAQPINLSSFRLSKSNFRKKGNGLCQLKLGEGERLVILGSYGLRVESGEVTVYGATLKASKSVSWVHAPQSHALPVIRCTNEVTLELQSHPNAQGLKDLGTLSPLFRKLWRESLSSPSDGKDSRSRETFRILYTSEDGPKRAVLQDLKSPAEWNREMAAFIASKDLAPSIMITGPKSSGKSTFGKILTNRLLTRTHTHARRPSNRGIVVLDLDPGQPEYCGAGQIALVLVTKPVLSPSFCRPLDVPGIRTVRSHALASLSPASDPELYIEMALDLITHYRNAFGSYPLVINTPGWIQGTGLDLLVSLIGELRPSEVIYMSQTGPADAVEALGGACNATRFSTLPSHPNQISLRTAIHLRSMQTMAYFHAEPAVPENSGIDFRWVQKPLTAMAPWQVRFRGASRGIFGFLCYDFQTQPDLVADAINGAVLAVVEIENTKAFRDIKTHQSVPNNLKAEVTPGSVMELDITEVSEAKSPPLSLLQDRITTLTSEGIPFIDTSLGLTLDPRYSRSLGLALVRGIDVENGDLHLLCPITTNQVEDVRTRGGQIILVSGKFDPPSWAYTEDLYFQSQGDEVDGNEGVGSRSRAESIEVDSEDMAGDSTTTSDGSTRSVPWIEILARNQKRGAGSKVWRVRRDLGRVGNPAG
ncbi:hypothetical protein E0Z10_g6899 [Xylaria hypoxylon]|uniref:Polynucleotide 5'-hydroxyl-kinase GRC3 n=1 Tax=Xylaria hypoxylon TaxID=37992 RepID=A0A4Z0YPB7_9PEZI|nr:hypothetical protein E0Z10_g6899 [Xylaria hypoxylon]